MKTLLRLLLGLCVSAAITARVFAESDEPKLSPEEMEKQVACIALYPDSLIALILPASTASSDVVLAARFFAGGGKQKDIDKQFWNESVKSLAHYPDVIKWMDENLEWTQHMGEVFVAQPDDVMAAIQRMRQHARDNDMLTDTPQQKVVVEQDVIYIEPADPEYIYIPRYDPDVLWMRRPFRENFISFGFGLAIGDWLYFDCDWFGHAVYEHRRYPGWVYRPGWRPPAPAVRMNAEREWHPDPRTFHPRPPEHRPPPVAIVPRPFSPEVHGEQVEHREQLDHRDKPDQPYAPGRWRNQPTPAPSISSAPIRPQPPATSAIAPQRRDNPVLRNENTDTHQEHAQPPARPTPPAKMPTHTSTPPTVTPSAVPSTPLPTSSSSHSSSATSTSRPAPQSQPQPSSSSKSSSDDSNDPNKVRGYR